jgi:hypothetical protein
MTEEENSVNEAAAIFKKKIVSGVEIKDQGD